jgi:WD40 repeat protein
VLTASPSSTSEPSASATILATLVPPLTPDPDSELISPDGKIVARLYSEFVHPSGKETLEIWNAEGSVMWVVPYQGEMPTYDPRPSLSLYKWSPDSSALYFYYTFGYDGFWSIFDGNDLQSIEVKTGIVKDTVPGSCIAFGFSPDMSKLAYTRGAQITIRDMTTGAEKTAEIRTKGFEQAGQIVWSPTGNRLVFQVLMDEGGNTQLIYLDANSMKQKVILEDFIEDYLFQGWIQDENLQYRKVDSTIVIVDIQTGVESIIGTATPRP